MRTLEKSLLSAYGGYAFRTLYLLVLIPLYARTLGPEAYGLVLTAMAVQNIVWVVQNWGFSFTGARNIARNPDLPARQQEFSAQITGRLLLTPLALAVGGVAVLLSPLLQAHPLVAGLAVLCGVLSGYNLGWYFQGRLDFATPVLIEGAGCLVTLALVLWGVRGPADVVWVMAALLTSGALTLGASFGIVVRQLKLRLAAAREGLAMIRRAAPLFITGGATTLVTTMGTYALSALATPQEVAHYGTAEKVIVTLLGLLGPVGQVLLSWFSHQISIATGGDALRVARNQFKAVGIVCVAGGVGMLLALTVMPPLLSLWLGPRYEAVGQTLRMLSPLLLLGAFNNALALYVMVPRGQERPLSQISVAMAIVGVLAIFCGAWLDGARGVAIARVATEIAVGITYVLFLRQSTGSFLPPRALRA